MPRQNSNFVRSCARVLGVGVAGLLGVAHAQPVFFTGDVEADFGPGAIILPDPNGVDVGMPLQYPAGSISGNDIKDVRFSYDADADVMYVGFNVYGIASDVDSEGGPDVTGPILSGLGGTDMPQVGDTESITLIIDVDEDGVPDVTIGVSSETDLDGFAATRFAGSAFVPGFAYGAPLAQHTGVVAAAPSAATPDFEFTVPGWSALPSSGVDLSPGFAINGFIGSFADAGIGEDFTPGAGQFAAVCIPQPETCDGLDNDCDGQIDEGFDVGAECGAGVGACAVNGVRICQPDGTAACSATPADPQGETCNGIDDDCDGSTDEGTGGGLCTGDRPGVCATGALRCVDGGLRCDPATEPRAERCDGLDDDCDGQTDEDFAIGQDCAVGVGECRVGGVYLCNADGTRRCSGTQADPGVETCDTLDNDCDGRSDEGFDVGSACSVGVGACAARGERVCGADGQTTCSATPGQPAAEQCNGVDDDCDGRIDEGTTGDGCFTGEPGVCSTGVTTCSAGVPGCVPQVQPSAETCDGIDSDCDGSIDEGFGVGEACAEGTGSCRVGGIRICAGDGTARCSATPSDPVPEACDGDDNDCDGTIDEDAGGGRCTTGALGACAEGTVVCTGGAIQCVPVVEPGAEQCNDRDDDCDGTADEGLGIGEDCRRGVGGCAVNGVQICGPDGAVTCSATPADPLEETCNTVDDDCDGRTDEGYGVGDACTAGVGACMKAGTIACDADGGAACTAQAGTPGDEICDAADNDCDGSVDEGLGLGEACREGVGACAADGVLACTLDGGVACNANPDKPIAETCDGIDNDCDGTIDEGFGVGDVCNVGAGACAAAGTIVCDANGGAACDAEPGAPGAESCDALDNDCDGTIDEGFGVGDACQVGQGICANDGNIVCANGEAVCSAVEGYPRLEDCNGADDDCDGSVDEGTGGGACNTGEAGACGPGTNVCENGALTCRATGGAGAETCEGTDQDCDGSVDEGFGVGDDCSVGVGACAANGHLICDANGGATCDTDPGTPVSETCDGVDNDCDGTIDEGTGGGACNTGEPGVCGPGTSACVAGALTCQATTGPGVETCEGTDQDCDGSVDEGFGVGDDCAVGVGACAASGHVICDANGGATCDTDPGTPVAETCDGIDNDCDGTIDEGFGLGDACNEGQGACAAAGNIVCDGSGGTTCDAEPGAPGAETCNAADDDCDGTVDEGFGVGDACQVGEGICANDGNIVCANGEAVCSAVEGYPRLEDCNGQDDDCDGNVDEGTGGGACNTGEAGACGPGTNVCENGALTCRATGGAGAETCEGTDQDCDGSVDEGFGVGDDCSVGVGACAADGHVICDANGGATCDTDPGTPVAETCDGIDNDCDGTVDEGFGVGDACQVGEGICANDGTIVCVDGAAACSAVEGYPRLEDCNGEDDDCDGTVDEGTGGGACNTGEAGACGPGTNVCENGALTCRATGEAGVETCDGTDEDCDGTIDEGFGVGDACSAGEGACAADGAIVCRDGGAVCDAEAGEAQAEICDGVDNDCDGATDEDAPAQVYAADEYAPGGHALWAPNFYGDGATTKMHFADGATFTVRDDGTARIEGDAHVVAGGVPGETWFVEMELVLRGQGPAFGGPKIERAAAQPPAVTDLWIYYDLVDGTVVRGEQVASLTQRPADGRFPFQFGATANGKNDNLGASMWFDWTLTDGDELIRRGHGDININLEPLAVCGDVCAGGEPQAETCNGADDDCDGIVDEGFGTGGACMAGEGACGAMGQRVCDLDGGVTCDAVAAEPGEETCDYADNDCDGLVDEGYDLGVVCDAGVGACGAQGETICGADGDVVCDAEPGAPGAETCDAIDNDCDGTIDEGYAVGDACSVGVGACGANGTVACDGEGGAQCDAEPGAPAAETCDATDNDCDGSVDEGLGLGDDCSVGEGACAANGTQVCAADGGVTCSATPADPQAEACDALDNDCDGNTDEGLGLGDACSVGQGACAADGAVICDGDGGTTCSAEPGAPAAEACDGLDNDCDGRVDEGLGLGERCSAGLGVCATDGAIVCDGMGGTICDAQPAQPGDEVCDDLDNDCDGHTDEGFGVGDACSAGQGLCRAHGERVCDGSGGVVCDAQPGDPAEELCDEEDNDCDGLIDEDFDLEGDCAVGLGECRREGQRICGEDDVFAGLGGNLILNGSFEQPRLERDWQVFQAIPSWETVAGQGIEIQRIHTGAEGTQYVELDSHPAPGGGCMMQVIPVHAGGIYRLGISHSPRPNVADNRVAIFWDGAEIAELDGDGRGLADTHWSRYAFDVTGNGAQGTLVICDVTNDRDTLGGFVDDVSLAMVEGIMCDAQPGEPTDERCDSLDNDCDGFIDEDLGIGEACEVGEGACAAPGAWQCDEDGDVFCAGVPGEPGEEACDDIDNDCDGAVDEGDVCAEPCSECDGKVTRLTLRYDGAEAADIVVDQRRAGRIFAQRVEPGATFELVGVDRWNTLGTEINVQIVGGDAVRIHTSCSVPIGPGERFGAFTVVEAHSRNGGLICPVDGPEPPQPEPEPEPADCSACDGKVTRLTLRYDGAEAVHVTVNQRRAGVIFDARVEPGEAFELVGVDRKGTLGTEITVSASRCDAVRIHTSCSVPIGPGERFGDFTVVEAYSRNGGLICAQP